MTEHFNTAIPTFNTLANYLRYYNDLSIWTWYSILIILSCFLILFFAFKHFQLLVINITKFLEYKKTKDYEKLKTSNSEVNLMSIPLTFAMSINVLFILWALFVPNLWNVVEYLFPFAILWFLVVWFFALKIFLDYFTRLLLTKSFDFVWNNTLWQMISVFAFAMVWVWFAAPVAMSWVKTTIAVSLIFSLFFITLAFFFWFIKIILWFKSILKQWLDKESSPTLWIIIPVLTLIWISLVRQQHWLHQGFDINIENWTLFVLTTIIFSLQSIFWFMGYKVMKANNYFKDYVSWKKKSASSFSLICPWVALVVFWFFFLHLWFVKNEIFWKFTLMYLLLLLPIMYVQYITVITIFKLNKKFFK